MISPITAIEATNIVKNNMEMAEQLAKRYGPTETHSGDTTFLLIAKIIHDTNSVLQAILDDICESQEKK